MGSRAKLTVPADISSPIVLRRFLQALVDELAAQSKKIEELEQA